MVDNMNTSKSTIASQNPSEGVAEVDDVLLQQSSDDEDFDCDAELKLMQLKMHMPTVQIAEIDEFKQDEKILVTLKDFKNIDSSDPLFEGMLTAQMIKE